VSVAPRADLAVEPHAVVAAFVPALEQVGFLRRQHALPRWAVRALRLDRPAAGADAPGDVGHIGPGGVQAADGLVLLDTARVALSARLLGPLTARG